MRNRFILEMLYIVANAILRPEYHVGIAFGNEEEAIDARDYYLNHLETNTDEVLGLEDETIIFKNGSTINFFHPDKDVDVVRCLVSRTKPLIDGFEWNWINQKDVNEIITSLAEGKNRDAR